ncbi:hypothetical protein NDU88_004622 [Pleurodeles waltl]|uniref:Uncharacterized protein n=1 Tax=Pleurodeles waltl TaxID=8319 RepID=A0AAV7WAW3_PLEWA|nr:hypothetical protein NDU88_004622 [Pleurodeles waltl]
MRAASARARGDRWCLVRLEARGGPGGAGDTLGPQSFEAPSAFGSDHGPPGKLGGKRCLVWELPLVLYLPEAVYSLEELLLPHIASGLEPTPQVYGDWLWYTRETSVVMRDERLGQGCRPRCPADQRRLVDPGDL